MKRKLQVFVSSTFEDLREDRQAAVEAILKAGHIPAGMELFTAGSESQLHVIRRWIEESDLYLLILGGRYGSIEPKSGLSYTEVEFDYARSLGKPFFSVVVSDQGLEERVKHHGTKVLERDNGDKLKSFRTKVTSQMCAFFDNPKDIKLAVFETIPQLSESVPSGGWVAAANVAPSEDVARQLTALLEENRLLRTELEKAQSQVQRISTEQGSLDQLTGVLERELVSVPEKISGAAGNNGKPLQVSVLDLALIFSEDLARGVANNAGASATEAFVFYKVASRLASYGLVEESKVPGTVHWQRLKLSKEGVKFLTRVRLLREAASPRSTPVASPAESSVSVPPDQKKRQMTPQPSPKENAGKRSVRRRRSS